MAQRLLNKKLKIDAFVSSPARRAKKTAELFCEAYKQSTDNINYISALYHAPAREFYEVINSLDDSLQTVAIFAHNPGITYFVNGLADNVRVDNMPTCAIFAIQVDAGEWKNFAKAKKEFLFFDYPKKA